VISQSFSHFPSHFSLGSLISLSGGVWSHLLPPSNGSTAVCADDAAFLDEFGEGCSACKYTSNPPLEVCDIFWVYSDRLLVVTGAGYDCTDRQQAADWGYSASTVDDGLFSNNLDS
jgi:hypothetical protein